MTTRINQSEISTTGNVIGNLVRAGTISATGNITSGYFLGNGSQLTGIVAVSSYNNSNVTTLLAGFGSNTISSTGNVTTTANISGGYILGNGSQLTGIVAVSSYGNSNVTTLLANLGSNTVSTTGNISGGYIFGNGSQLTGMTSSANSISNGNSNVRVPASNGNVAINANGGSNYQWTFDTTGNITLPAGGAIQTAIGSNGNILIHPDGNGIVTIQGNTTGSLLFVTGDEPNSQNRIEVDTFGNISTLGGTFTGRFARGTAAAPAAPQNTDQLAAFKGKGWANGSYTFPTGQILLSAVGNWSSSNYGTSITFWNTPLNLTTIQEVARISADGSYNQLVGNIIVANGVVKTNAFTVSTLPPAANTGVGSRSFVTDADTRSFGNVAVGGAGNSMPVWTDGTNWYIG